MKKFLTVLLALSVVFTYTVGTAFAAGVTVADEEKTALQHANDIVDEKADTVKGDAERAGVYDDAAILAAIEEVSKKGHLYAQSEYEKMTSNGQELNADNLYNTVKSWVETNYDKMFKTAVKSKDLKIKVDAAKELVSAVKPTDYIEKDQKTVADYKVAVLAELDKVIVGSNTIKNLFSKPNLAADEFEPAVGYAKAINIYLYGGMSAWEQVFDEDSTPEQVNNALVQGFFGALNKLTTIAESDENKELTDAYVENIIANITYNAKAYAKGFYLTNKVAAGKDVTSLLENGKVYGVKVAKASKITAAEATAINNALMGKIDDTLEVLAVRVQEIANKDATDAAIIEELDDQVDWYKNNANFAEAMPKALAAKDFYGDVVAYANKMKDAVTFAGDKMYADADIDAKLVEAKAKIYGKYYEETYSKVERTYFVGVTPVYDEVAVAIKMATEKWQPSVIYSGANKTAEADKKYCADFYAPNEGIAPTSVSWQDEYADIEAEAKAALEDAKTVAEVDAIMTDAANKLADLRLAADDTVALKDAIEKRGEALTEYVDEQWKLADDTKYSYDRFEAAYDDGVELLKAVKSADDLTAAYAEAKALLKNIKTTDELDAAAKKVEDAILALPTTAPRLENEAAYMAVYDQFKAYLENYGADKFDIDNYNALEKAMGNLKPLQEVAVEEAIADMNKDKVVTRAEYEAVKAMYDRYADYYEQYDEDFDADEAMAEAIEAAGEIVWLNEVNAVKNMIAKLTTASSVKDVLAAKAAYEALTGSQQRAVMRALDTAWTYKLELMQTIQIQAVESMKVVKAHSAAGKGYIKVMWEAVGDNAAIDGFQVYKSTKAQSGYTFMGKTTKNYMTNKKNLKKGKRYFYKVRAYADIDGVRYFSDWSNKANRIAK